MRFTTVILAALATLTIAAPLADPKEPGDIYKREPEPDRGGIPWKKEKRNPDRGGIPWKKEKRNPDRGGIPWKKRNEENLEKRDRGGIPW
jgi:hypothetical protein